MRSTLWGNASTPRAARMTCGGSWYAPTSRFPSCLRMPHRSRYLSVNWLYSAADRAVSQFSGVLINTMQPVRCPGLNFLYQFLLIVKFCPVYLCSFHIDETYKLPCQEASGLLACSQSVWRGGRKTRVLSCAALVADNSQEVKEQTSHPALRPMAAIITKWSSTCSTRKSCRW